MVVKQPKFTRVEEPTLLCNQVGTGLNFAGLATYPTLPHSLEESLQCNRIYRDRTLSFGTQEVTVEGSVEDYWIDFNLLDRAAGGAALHWFRT